MYALLDIGLLIVAAKVSERVLGRLGLHTAVACTLAGALLGPLAGIVEPTGVIPLLLGAGAVVFFFIVGLDEIDVPGVIAAARGRYFAAAAVSVGVAVLAALLVTSDLSGAGFALGLDFYAALALAGVLALSSVGVVSRVLAGKGLLKDHAGLRMFTAVIIAEALALLLVAATISRFDYGLVAIGALVLGASVSGLPHRMRADILPGVRRAADALVVPLFFAAAGLHLDLSFSALPAATIAAVVCIPLAGKFAGALVGARLAGLDTPFAVATGQMAKGATEIAFLVVLLQSGAIGRGVFSLLVLVMFGYILLGPPAIGAALDRTRARERPARPRMVLPSFARHALAGVTVNSVLDRTRAYPGPELPVRSFLDEWTVPYQYDYLVVEDGAPAGIVSLSKLRSVADRQGADAPLGDVIRRRMPRAWPDEPIDDVLQRMAGHWVTVVPVVDRDSGEFLGTVTSHDLLDLVALMDEIEEEVQQQGAGA